MAAAEATPHDRSDLVRAPCAHEASPARSSFAREPRLVQPLRVLSLAAARKHDIFLAVVDQLRVVMASGGL